MKLLIVAVTVWALQGASSLRAADGRELYVENCMKCHGEDGNGKTKMAEKLGMTLAFTDAKLQDKLKDEDIAKAIKEGIKEKDTGKKRMRAFDDLSEAEIKMLVSYVRTFKK